MKTNTLSLILNAVLFVAVAVLYYDEFFEEEDDDEQPVMAEEAPARSLAIAYVNTDSLLARYKYFEKVSRELDKKRERLQREYTRRAETLQKQFEDFQRTMGNMTIGQARAVEEDLARRRQNLLQYQETITQDMMREEARITQELYDKVADFLKEYGEENGLQVVLTYTPGSGVLYANEALDITSEVIAGLNQAYEAGEQAGQAADSLAEASE